MSANTSSLNLKSFKKVKFKRKNYGKFYDKEFYIDKNIPSWVEKGMGWRGGKHVCEILEREVNKNFVLILTTKKSEIVNSKYVFLNFEDFQNLGRDNFMHVWRDAGELTAHKFSTEKLGLHIASKEKSMTRKAAREVVSGIPGAIQKLPKSEKDDAASSIVKAVKSGDFSVEHLEFIVAASKQAHYNQALTNLENLVNENFKLENKDKKWESKYNKWFKSNYWIFGNEYKGLIDRTTVGLEEKVDLRFETVDGYQEIIELKTPNVEVLNYDKSHDTFYPTADLSKAFTQSMHYIHVMEREENSLNTQAEKKR